MKKIREVAQERNCCRIDWVQFKNNDIGDQFFKQVNIFKDLPDEIIQEIIDKSEELIFDDS